MPRYITLQHLIDRFGEQEIMQLADRDNDDVIDQAVVDTAIERSEAEIEAALATRYKTPFSDTPKVVIEWACDMARYYLYTDGAPEQVDARYNSVINLLKMVQSGKMNLGLSASDQIPANTSKTVVIESTGSTFSRTNNTTFI